MDNSAHKTKSVCFSGHRTLEQSSQLQERVRGVVRGLCEQGYVEFYCGMAQGFDLLAGEAVLSLRGEFADIRLIAVLPFPEQADRFGRELRGQYDTVFRAADRTVVVSPSYHLRCFHQRNDYLLDHSSVLVCFFDGSSGGTKYTVARAQKLGHLAINIYPRPIESQLSLQFMP